MEASFRLLASRHLSPAIFSLLRNPKIPKITKTPFRSPNPSFRNPISSPFLSLSVSHFSTGSAATGDGGGGGGGELRFRPGKGEIYTVVLLGWLGAEEKHLKRYAEMYGSSGIRPVKFVVPMKETVGPDLGRRVEERIERLGREIVDWCEESNEDGIERSLIFHTFSNTGWFIYGVLLQNFQSRSDIIKRIKGCVVDSAPSAEISPQVWAAGYCAAMLKRRHTPVHEIKQGGKSNGESNKVNTEDMIPALTEMIFLKLLELLFSIVLQLPYAKQRLNSIIATLKDQPPCPQLYLYSSADKVIPAHIIESFIKEQKALGKIVYSYDFGTSPHVDHFRSFPHIYSAKVNEFLKICCAPMVCKR